MKRRVVAELVPGSIGVALVVCAFVFDQAFLDKHFLPSFLIPREWYVLIERIARVALAVAGVLLAFVLRKPIARAPATTIGVAIAAILALVASEAVLTRVRLRPTGWLVAEDEPQRRPDPRLGWTLVPARTGHKRVGGRVLDYTIDANGYRVRRADEPVDPERSTIVFSGESVMLAALSPW